MIKDESVCMVYDNQVSLSGFAEQRLKSDTLAWSTKRSHLDAILIRQICRIRAAEIRLGRIAVADTEANLALLERRVEPRIERHSVVRHFRLDDKDSFHLS
jgi:hypothetical protein